jgi:hypothetical protein
MMRFSVICALLTLTLSAIGAERAFRFGDYQEGGLPPGFRSTVTGKGKPGDWKLIIEPVPSLLPPLTSGPAPSHSGHTVLAQTARDPTDEHFPLLVYDDEKFGDFTLTTKIKTVRGVVEQMAGIAFRIQNESNYYVVRASSLGNTFRFYKVLDGQRGPPVGPELPIPAGTWHDLTVDCKGNQIRCLLDGKEQISVNDKANALTSGKIGFWTKSDSVSYFGDTTIVYVPFETAAQKIVQQVLLHYPRLLDVKIYVPGKDAAKPKIIACRNNGEIGQLGAKTEQEVIGRGETYFGKENDVLSVIMPLRDRNGDAMAAVRVVMKGFPGQTEENAIIRANPIVREIQSRAQGLDDLLE